MLYLPLVKIHLVCEHIIKGSEKSCRKETCLQTKHFPNLFDHKTFPHLRKFYILLDTSAAVEDIQRSS